ncbi:MAG: sugar-transfer associated ATP-grasp domain-containing protein [Clostridia bacterium]|nr:sugar-transfer associated ATP-grasp domain-containing protein [Clostridia bacterium]
MGIINFALSGNYKRFYKDLKDISKINKKPAILMFVDTAISTVLFGSGLQDYLNFKFYEKSFKERKTYVTIGNMDKAYKILANIKYAPFFSNKISFHKNFCKYTKRDFLSPYDTLENFEKFISKHEEFVIKPQIGLGGADVLKIKTSQIKNKKEFFENIKTTKCFVEELVVQDEEWGALSPNSINTIRIMTGAVNRRIKNNICSSTNWKWKNNSR